MKITGSICSKCFMIVYPRSIHDIVTCTCENTTIFQNDNGVFVTVKLKRFPARLVELNLKVTRQILEDDLNAETELFGRIPKRKDIDLKLLDKMIECSKELIKNPFFYEQWARLIQRRARQESKQC